MLNTDMIFITFSCYLEKTQKDGTGTFRLFCVTALPLQCWLQF